ncbi:MAG: ABC transporter permease [Flavobacteriaceae bacterium]|jgi:putative ABC transport system permease protein|nr:ABC transporter permease [Flavobacteriaceae bacterium]MCI5089150.1 ABC transporter permease [Flavobacteriaceae bacterium]CAI8191023.1 MAG: Macrolide export ATP-binding/permease protein MacB [SAR116 cluster bacterium]
MFSRDRWKEIIEVLTTNWFRTLLTAFGVFWGILILIILLAAGKGLENGIRADFGDIATNTMFVWTRSTTKAYQGLPIGRRFSYTTEDVAAIWAEIPGLRFVSPRNQIGSSEPNVIRGVNKGAYNIYGDYPEIIRQDPLTITSGRFINPLDIQESRKIAVIGQGVVQDLYEEGTEPIGSFVTIQGVNFKVVGVYKKEGNEGNQNAQKEIYVPFSSFSKAFNRGNRVGWMAITAQDGTPITAIKEDIFSLLKKKHKIAPDDKRAVGHFDLYEEFSRVESLFGAMRFIAFFVGILVLISGVIGVSNIMLIVVKERTKEIGIRRALGASPFSIKLQILMESVFLTIISGMFGIVVGALFIYGINYVLDLSGPVDMFMSPTVHVGVVISALVILIVSGLFAGFIPARSAIKVKPIEALRTE